MAADCCLQGKTHLTSTIHETVHEDLWNKVKEWYGLKTPEDELPALNFFRLGQNVEVRYFYTLSEAGLLIHCLILD